MYSPSLYISQKINIILTYQSNTKIKNTNTWIKRSANIVMWTLCNNFVSFIHFLDIWEHLFRVNYIWKMRIVKNKDWYKKKRLNDICCIWVFAQGFLYCMVHGWMDVCLFDRQCVWGFKRLWACDLQRELSPLFHFISFQYISFTFYFWLIKSIFWCLLLLDSSFALSVSPPLKLIEQRQIKYWGQTATSRVNVYSRT